MLGGRLPADLKDYFDEEARLRNLTQAQLLEEVVEFYFDNQPKMTGSNSEEEDDYKYEMDYLSMNLEGIFGRSTGRILNCSIIQVYKETGRTSDPSPVSSFALKLSERMHEISDHPEFEVRCGDDYSTILDDETRDAVGEILRAAIENIGSTADRSDLFATIAVLAEDYSKEYRKL